MRILAIAALFPPNIIGGAEISAFNLITWLKDQGHDCGVLTAAQNPAQLCNGAPNAQGVRVWRHYMPRQHPIIGLAKAPGWQKPFWHLQDHLDPRNSKLLSHVLDDFAPDFVNIHIIQGIGYNSLAEIARRGIPACYFLHDMGLACIRMNMFKNGLECVGQCRACAISTGYKLRHLKRFERLGFCSPSRANLEKLAEYMPLKSFPHAAILNANQYPKPNRERQPGKGLHFLYAGRLHVTKGVDILLSAAAELAGEFEFTVTILGSGPDEAGLHTRYGQHEWCKFIGHVPHQEVANHIGDSDMLCIPSVWMENSPGVVIHALGLGVPVIGSDKGGIPELVRHGDNGLLAPPGDVAGWTEALRGVLTDDGLLERLKANAVAQAGNFSRDAIGRQIFGFMNEIAGNA